MAFQSFTGSSRRPRQVNLSGKTANPFAAAGLAPPGSSSSASKNALANAQQERAKRQQERDQLNAARRIKRSWAGYRAKKDSQKHLREEFLDDQSNLGFEELYDDEAQCLRQLRLYLSFARPDTDREDLEHLEIICDRIQKAQELGETDAERKYKFEGEEWRYALVRLENVVLHAVAGKGEVATVEYGELIDHLLSALEIIVKVIPKETARNGALYYSSLTQVAPRVDLEDEDYKKSLHNAFIAPLLPITSESTTAYAWFAIKVFTLGNLESLMGLDQLFNDLNYKLLANALGETLRDPSSVNGPVVISTESRLWLLAHFVYFHQLVFGKASTSATAPDIDYTIIVSHLLSSLADEIGSRIDAEDEAMEDVSDLDIDEAPRKKTVAKPLHPFVKKQLLSLVNQQSVTKLLSHAGAGESENTLGSRVSAKEKATLLASYALTLLRVFPHRGDEIRMWLYMGSSSTGINGEMLSPIKYFWKAVQTTTVYRAISRNHDAVLEKLRPRRDTGDATKASSTMIAQQDENDQEWRVILLFLELYIFVLKVIDDDEFFSGGQEAGHFGETRRKRESFITLGEVKSLTIFLKNLAFTMYTRSADLTGSKEREDTNNLSSYFAGSSRQATQVETEPDDPQLTSVAGVTGMTLDYVKGVVTGLLRMVYERE
jgi:ubiquitin-protein ligase E3 C